MMVYEGVEVLCHSFLILVGDQLHTQVLYHQGKHHPHPLTTTRAGPDTLEKEKVSYTSQQLYLIFMVIQPVVYQS
jgi:hypothetical protein